MSEFESRGEPFDEEPTLAEPYDGLPAGAPARRGERVPAPTPRPVPVPNAVTARPVARSQPPVLRAVSWVVPFALFASVLLAVLWAAPLLLFRWRVAEADALAEAAYQKRRAELKAEMEAGQDMLNLVNDKAKLTTLGYEALVKLAAPKVVNIAGFRDPKPGETSVLTKQTGLIYDPDIQKYFVHVGVGSGLIAKPGVILTNHHVVKKVDRLRVTFASGQSVWVDMERVASDPSTDLAVVRLPDDPPAGLKDDYQQSAVFADSAKDVECGALVLAIGSPLGLKNTVTHGIISAKGRFVDMPDLEKIELYQTDAPINPGNSGGPLFNLAGKVVGINVAIASENGHNQGIGFVIPSSTAKAILEELLNRGEVTRGFIGVTMEELPPTLAKELKLDEKGTVRVKGIVPGFPADKAGLKKGDVIVSLDGKVLPIADSLSFFRQRVMESPVGTRIKLGVVRLRERGPDNPPGAAANTLREVQQLTLTIEVAAKPKLGQMY